MKYTIRYWVSNLSDITGFNQNDKISEKQLLDLIRKKEVQVMVSHAKAHDDVPDMSYCFIDDLNHQFQQR